MYIYIYIYIYIIIYNTSQTHGHEPDHLVKRDAAVDDMVSRGEKGHACVSNTLATH
jgi:hypothetical protein